MNELRNRGVEDIPIAIVDGLKGFPDAITAVFPRAQVQTCIVHLIRNSLDFVSFKDHKAVAADLREIYRAKDADALDAFAAGAWGNKCLVIAMSWRRHWPAVMGLPGFPCAGHGLSILGSGELDKGLMGGGWARAAATAKSLAPARPHLTASVEHDAAIGIGQLAKASEPFRAWRC